ncbi:putative transcription factor B3-Domain family [Helianthus annuus]|nr:putative transcription factor B3-Domain family [Helianthus annuus]KAJ0686972.1 putative transcription factor B3-Domain family [Helianthus annuus]KAJ0690777.1 putative transcription factor B3-Domain family [Helianthus annuus]
MAFHKSMSALTKEFLVIPLQFSKLWLSNAGGDNIVVIKCINEKDWNVKFSKNNGAFAFTEEWSKVVADLSLTEGCILLFRQLNPFNYLLTPFFKETPYPCCDPELSLFTSISSLPNRKYILLPTYVVKKTIGLGKLRRPMKVLVNARDSLDVTVEKDLVSKCYFFTNGWNSIVQHIGVRTEFVVVLRYLFDYNFQLTLFDVNGTDVSIPRIGLQVNSNSNIRNAAPLVNNVDAVEDEVDMNSDLDPEFDENDVEDSSGPSDDDKQDPDYEPLEFEWDYHPRHFRLNTKVASMARVDVSRKMTIQNLAGVDTVVTFRPEKHGGGFRYVANGWRTNFTKPNGINAPQRCTFVYSPYSDKLILKKVSK